MLDWFLIIGFEDILRKSNKRKCNLQEKLVLSASM
jgi:hypothetical protein